MPTPDFILALRERVGSMPLWLSGSTAVVLREAASGNPEVLLVRRADNGEWTPIAGIVDPGEGPEETAVRESAEEAGVLVVVERLVWVSVTDPVVYPNGDVTQYLDHTFRCRWMAGEARVGDEESSEVGWFTTDSMPSMSDHHRRRVEIALANPSDVVLGRGDDRGRA